MQWWQKKDKPNLISLYIPTYILHFLTEAVLNFSDFCIKVFKSMHSTEMSRAFFSLVYIKVVSISDSRTRLR